MLDPGVNPLPPICFGSVVGCGYLRTLTLQYPGSGSGITGILLTYPSFNAAEEVVNILRDKVNNSDHDDPYDIMGFDNEAEMVENLDAAISETNKTLSCFFRGAGK